MATEIKPGQVWSDNREEQPRYFKILERGRYWWTLQMMRKSGDDFVDAKCSLTSMTFTEFNAALPAMTMVKESTESEGFISALARAKRKPRFKPVHIRGVRD